MSTGAPPNCASNSSCGPSPASAGPRRRCPGCSWPAPRPIPVAGCTGPAGPTRPEPRWPTSGSGASCTAPAAEAGHPLRVEEDLERVVLLLLEDLVGVGAVVERQVVRGEA